MLGLRCEKSAIRLDVVLSDPPIHGSCAAVVAIGTFDGMHQGHRAVLLTTRQLAVESGCRAIAVTFYPRPEAVLCPHQALPDLVSLSERVAALRDAGADQVVVLRFSRELAEMPAEAFLEALAALTGLTSVCVGSDFTLGKGRRHDVTAIRALGYDVVAVPLQPGAKPGQKASSTNMRSALANGTDHSLVRRFA